jgi:hypothetical protein
LTAGFLRYIIFIFSFLLLSSTGCISNCRIDGPAVGNENAAYGDLPRPAGPVGRLVSLPTGDNSERARSMTENAKYNHPLYIAVAQIDYNSNDKFATVLCKTFSDDLELALQKKYAKNESIDHPENVKKLTSEIGAYIKNHLQLKINGKTISLVFTTYKKEDNTVSTWFRINNINDVQRFEVNDTIFYELYDKQIQIVYITVNGNRKSNRITNPESKVAFDF